VPLASDAQLVRQVSADSLEQVRRIKVDAAILEFVAKRRFAAADS
jgi:hypothetical protein